MKMSFHLGSNNVLPSPECCIKVVKTRSGGEVELGEYTVGKMVAVKRKRETHYFAEKKRHREDLVYDYAHRNDYEYYDEDYTIITSLCLKFNMLQLDDKSDLSNA